MPTRTTPRTPSRASRPTRARTAPTGRFARPTPATRPSLRRKPPQKSTADKALSGLVGLLPGSVLGRAATKPKAGSGGGGKGKKAGFALLAGAAGLALKKRNGRKTEEPTVAAPDPVAVTTPVAPPQTGPVTPV